MVEEVSHWTGCAPINIWIGSSSLEMDRRYDTPYEARWSAYGDATNKPVTDVVNDNYHRKAAQN